MIVGLGTALLCCLVLISEIFSLLTKSKKTFSHVFFIVISLIGILGTQNRGIIITFLLSLFFIFIFSLKAEQFIKVRINKIILTLIIVMIGFLLVFIHSPLYEKFEARIEETVETVTGEREFFQTITGIRVGRTTATFREWLKAPVLGCGWGSQITIYHIYDLEGNYVRTNYGTPHNYYITILYQTGIIGFFIMTCIFYRIFCCLKPRERLNQENTMVYSLFIFYLVFLVFNIANTLLYAHPVFIPVNFFLLGSAVSYSQQVKNS